MSHLAEIGFCTIALLLGLILTRKLTALSALIAVPVAGALAAGFGLRTGGFMVHGIQSVAPVAGMFIFAILYFGAVYLACHPLAIVIRPSTHL